MKHPSLFSRIRRGAYRPLTQCKVPGLQVRQLPMQAGIPTRSLGNQQHRPYQRIQCHHPHFPREQLLNRAKATLKTSSDHLTLRRRHRLPRSGLSPKPEALESPSLQPHRVHLFAPPRGLIFQPPLVRLKPHPITSPLVRPTPPLHQNLDRLAPGFSPSAKTPSVLIHTPHL